MPKPKPPINFKPTNHYELLDALWREIVRQKSLFQALRDTRDHKILLDTMPEWLRLEIYAELCKGVVTKWLKYKDDIRYVPPECLPYSVVVEQARAHSVPNSVNKKGRAALNQALKEVYDNHAPLRVSPSGATGATGVAGVAGAVPPTHTGTNTPNERIPRAVGNKETKGQEPDRSIR